MDFPGPVHISAISLLIAISYPCSNGFFFSFFKSINDLILLWQYTGIPNYLPGSLNSVFIKNPANFGPFPCRYIWETDYRLILDTYRYISIMVYQYKVIKLPLKTYQENLLGGNPVTTVLYLEP